MNNDIDSRALRVITDWNSREYKSEGQKAASLQVLIIAALTEQAAEVGTSDKYRGYRLFVEMLSLDDNVTLYEGVAQHNGTTVFTSKSLISGEAAERGLKDQIDTGHTTW